jgi:hypothetical protein
MRFLNPPSYASTPNDAAPWTGSGRAGYIGQVSNANPYLLKVAPDTLLWQQQVYRPASAPGYGIVASVGMGGRVGVPTTGTFVDLGDDSRFHVNRYARTEPRAHYPLRPVIAGAASARINPATVQGWYGPGYTSQLASQSDVLSAMLAKPSTGGY